MKKVFSLFLALYLGFFSQNAHAEDPYLIEILTLPFGTASYASDMALESLFKEKGSFVELLLKQTPGAMYITRYSHENQERMREGEVPFILAYSTINVTEYIAKGLPPYEDYPLPDSQIIGVVGGLILPFFTFDENIKTPADFKGQRVGVAEKSRPNMSILPNVPVFDYAYGGYDEVKWQYLGFSNSKDALLNGSIDVHMGNGSCMIKVDENGNYYTDEVIVDPSVMEIISAGKPFYVVAEDPEVLRAAYDPDKDLTFIPILVKAGAFPGLTEDVWVKGDMVGYSMDKETPIEVVEEIVYQMFKNRERLALYYEGFSTMDVSPYLAGVDHKWYHPGMFSAMKRLGLELPEGVVIE